MLKSESVQPLLPGRNGPDVKTPFRQVVQAANQCVVRIKCDGQDAALGTIVGPDGWILTKASEILATGRDQAKREDHLPAPRRARVGSPHRRRSRRPSSDLAMLKIDAVNLPIIPWNPLQPTVGQWLVTAGMEDDPLGRGHRQRSAAIHPAHRRSHRHPTCRKRRRGAYRRSPAEESRGGGGPEAEGRHHAHQRPKRAERHGVAQT